MIHQKLILFVCALAVFGVVFAQDDAEGKKPKKDKSADTEAKAGTEFKLGGVLETGFDVIRNAEENVTNNRMINRGEIEISARPIKGVRAEMGLEFNQRGSTHYAWPGESQASDGDVKIGPYITIDKFYAQYNLPGVDGQIRAGIMKKSFGLEERAGVDERYFHARSRINGELDDEHEFLDHDLTLMYRHDVGKNFLRFAGAFSWAVADSNRYFQNYSAQYDAFDNLTFILAAIIRHDYLSDGRIVAAGFSQNSNDEKTVTTFVTSFNALHAADISPMFRSESETEITYGINPTIRLNQAQGATGNREAYILGLRAQERFPITIGHKVLNDIIPVVELALYWDDLDLLDGKRFETELRGGLTLGFTKTSALQLRQSFAARWQMGEGTDIAGKTLYTGVERYRYNLQIVAIF